MNPETALSLVSFADFNGGRQSFLVHYRRERDLASRTSLAVMAASRDPNYTTRRVHRSRTKICLDGFIACRSDCKKYIASIRARIECEL